MGSGQQECRGAQQVGMSGEQATWWHAYAIEGMQDARSCSSSTRSSAEQKQPLAPHLSPPGAEC